MICNEFLIKNNGQMIKIEILVHFVIFQFSCVNVHDVVFEDVTIEGQL